MKAIAQDLLLATYSLSTFAMTIGVYVYGLSLLATYSAR